MVYGNLILEYESKLNKSEIFLESLKYNDTEVIYEGANIEITKYFVELLKDYRYQVKLFRKNVKEKDEIAARGNLRIMEQDIKKCRKKINSIDSADVSASVIGFIISFLIKLGEAMVPTSISLIVTIMAKVELGISLGTVSSIIYEYIKKGFSAKKVAIEIVKSAENMNTKVSFNIDNEGIKVSSIMGIIGLILTVINNIIAVVDDLKRIQEDLKNKSMNKNNAWNFYRVMINKELDDLEDNVKNLESAMKI